MRGNSPLTTSYNSVVLARCLNIREHEDAVMKEKAAVAIDNAFKLLLTGLPQGMLSGVIWAVYSAWTTLSMRRLIKI
jgi:hypothetical protein